MTTSKNLGGAATPVRIINTTTTPDMEARPIEGGAAEPVYVVGIESIAGITQVVTILDGDGATTHTLTFVNGVLTAYTVA